MFKTLLIGSLIVLMAACASKPESERTPASDDTAPADVAPAEAALPQDQAAPQKSEIESVYPLKTRPFKLVGFGKPLKTVDGPKKTKKVLRRQPGVYFVTKDDTEILSVKSGVIAGAHSFQSISNGRETCAVHVKNDDGTELRYGFLKCNDTSKLKAGQKVMPGDVLGKIEGKGFLLELYAGTEEGPLTQNVAGPFKRRSDLQDPTKMLKELEAKLPKQN